MTQLLWDLRFGLRLVRRNPGFSLAIALILAIGIGANTAMFSLVSALILRPLPYPDSDRITMVWCVQPMVQKSPLSVPDFLDWKAEASTFERMAAIDYQSFNISSEKSAPDHISGGRVSADFFPIFGVRAARGRVFDEGEDRPGHERVLVMSDALFRTRFASDPNVVGSTLLVDGAPYEVIGVLPPGFNFVGPNSDGGDLWAPLALSLTKPDGQPQKRGSHYLHAIGKLRAGASLADAEAQIKGIAKRLEEQFPGSNTGTTARLLSLHEEQVGNIKTSLFVLFGAIAFVLLIACANVANLLLARARGRRGEIAMRLALGASRAELVRQMLTESFVLAFLGGAAGTLVAVWCVDLFVAGLVSGNARTIPVHIDGLALGFVVLVCALTSLLFGLWPALAASRTAIQTVLQESATRATEGRGQGRLKGALVVAEISLAFVLLVGAGLLLKNFWRISTTDPGFDPKGALTAQIALPDRYDEGDRAVRFYEALVARLKALPQVKSASATTATPMGGNNTNGSFVIEGRSPWPLGEQPLLENIQIMPGYFKVFGVDLLAGREFDERDKQGGRDVMMINETAAKKYFPGEDPVGKRIDWGWSNEPRYREIVGVVRDVRNGGLLQPVRPESYVPIAQQPTTRMGILVRGVDLEALRRALPLEVQALDPAQPVFRVRTLEQVLEASTQRERFNMMLFSAFAFAALLLASIGVYSLVSHSTSQRTREIGIRMALGAPPSRVARLVVREGAILVFLGLTLGGLAALASGGAMRAGLDDMSAADPKIFGIIAVLLGSIGVLASLIPALRAVRVSPAVALRYE